MSELILDGTGPQCGLHIPKDPEEVNAILDFHGLSREAEHPLFREFNLDAEVSSDEPGDDLWDLLEDPDLDSDELFGSAVGNRIGTRIQLPNGTPKLPGGYSPFAGARRGRDVWSRNTFRTQRLIGAKAPGIVRATYAGHGRTGIAYGIDAMTSRFTVEPTRAQLELLARLTNWAVSNWSWLNLDYWIANDRMNDGAGWFSYTPWSKPCEQGGWCGGSPNMTTRKHRDHGHAQVI